MGPLFWFGCFVVWVWAAVLAGGAAQAKGHGSTGAFAAALFLSPVLGLLYAAALPDRNQGMAIELLRKDLGAIKDELVKARPVTPAPLPCANCGRAQSVPGTVLCSACK